MSPQGSSRLVKDWEQIVAGKGFFKLNKTDQFASACYVSLSFGDHINYLSEKKALSLCTTGTLYKQPFFIAKYLQSNVSDTHT